LIKKLYRFKKETPLISESLIPYNQTKKMMIHKIKYFESKHLAQGVYLQDVVNVFLAEKGENIVAVLPVMQDSLLVHYKE
jgi:hypothetical protein